MNLSGSSLINSGNTPLEQVLDQSQIWQDQRLPDHQQALLSSGFTSLDTQLPGGGWQAGQVCEVYHQGLEAGELSLILPALASLSQQPKWILWVAPPAIPYAPTLTLAGVRLKHILVVHPKSYQEAIWCLEEGLRSGHCSAVLGWLHESHERHVQRLQLAASDTNSHCWLWPHTGFDPGNSPATLRLGIKRLQADVFQVELFKRRGCWPSQPFEVALASARK